jgi:type I restriction enzyme, S subunit
MKYTLADLFEKPISGEWGVDLNEGEKGVKVIRTTNFTNLGRLNLSNVVVRNIDTEKYKNKALRYGDIIIEKSGGSPTQPVGRVVVFEENTDEKYFCNNFTSILRPTELVNYKYSLYLLKDLYKKGEVLRYQNKTTGIINIRINEYIQGVEVTVPNKEIQQKIAEALDKAQLIIDKRKAQLECLDELVKSRFIEMFGDLKSNSKHWNVLEFDSFATIDTKMTKDFEKYKDYPHIGIESIEKNTGRILDYKLVKDSELISGKYLFDRRHIIYSKIRPNLNKVALPEFNGVCSADAYPILCNDNVVIRNYLGYVLRSEFFLNYILAFSGRTNIPKVNKEQLKGFRMPTPPIDIQNQFDTFVNQIDKLKFEMQKSLTQLENNFNVIMQRAFKG